MKKISIRFKLTEFLFRHTVKPMMAKSAKDPKAYLDDCAKKQGKPLPLKSLHKQYSFDECSVNGTPYYAIHSRKQKSDQAILYFFGGGFVMSGDSGDFEFGQDMADNTGADVWLVWYPLFPKARAIDILKASVNVYEEALKRYSPDKITLFGLSAGASLCILTCIYAGENALPMPSKIIPFSPTLRIPPLKSTLEKMIEKSKGDCMIPAEYILNVEKEAELADMTGCKYFYSPIEKSWKGFPPMLVFFGGNEVLSCQIPELKSKCAEDGVELQIFVGEGMMHTWAAAGFLPECRPARERIYHYIKQSRTKS